MGVYYHYCNLDRLEHFSVGLCGGAIKHAGVGRGLTARLLARLLMPPPEGSEEVLNWAGDRVVILGDEHPVPTQIGLPPAFLRYGDVSELLYAEFRDVSKEALGAMIHLEPDELESAARAHDSVFEDLGTHANAGVAVVETWLRQRFGKDWRKEWAKRMR